MSWESSEYQLEAGSPAHGVHIRRGLGLPGFRLHEEGSGREDSELEVLRVRRLYAELHLARGEVSSAVTGQCRTLQSHPKKPKRLLTLLRLEQDKYLDNDS